MRNGNVAVLGAVVLLATVLLAACGGGGGGSGSTDTGGGSATPLVVAGKVSIVDPKADAAVTKPRPKALFLAASLPADIDYSRDQTNVYVQEQSIQAFNTVNNILCSVAMTKYDVMLNQGAYIALVDQNLCDANRGDASSAGQAATNQSSGSNAPRYQKWTVESTRANDSAPQIVKVWVHEEADDHNVAKVIHAKAVITEGKSDANPYGIFRITFVGYAVSDASVLFKGYLQSERDPLTGKILLKFASDDTGNQSQEQATLDRGLDNTGKGTIYQKYLSNEITIDIAYDADYFLRDNGTTAVCLNRNTFDTSAWSYGLYHADGARLNRNSGFSINTTANGSGTHGWVGYWGLWIDNNATVSNDQQVYAYDYRTKQSTAYRVFKASGKLKKHTRNTNLTLNDVKGIPLDYWDNGMNYRVVWDDAAQAFVKKAQMPSNCSNNCTWADITTQPTPTIDVSRLQWSDLNFWSQSLGGQVRVPLQNCQWSDPDGPGGAPGFTDCSSSAPGNATHIVFYKEDIIYPTDTVPANLACYDSCLKAGPAGINDADAMHSSWDPMTGMSSATTYSFDPAIMLLKDGGNGVVTAPSSSIQFGYMTGALFDPSVLGITNPDTGKPYLQCDWQNQSGGYDVCGWKAWSELPVFYTWETGPNNWNQFVALKDGQGQFLTFDPPLQVKYVDASGRTYMLDYAGFGNLQGIPGKCVNWDTGEDTDCSNGGSGTPVRWVPEFTIPAADGFGNLTTVSDGTNDYFVKPLEMEQRMKEDANGCSTLTTQTYALPPLNGWTDPANGAEPSVTAPPAVIGGVVQ